MVRPCSHPSQRLLLGRGTKDKERAMSHTLNTTIAVVGVDIGKNSFHIEEMEKRSRQRVRDQVAHMAFGAETRMRSSARGLSMMARNTNVPFRAGYRSARPITSTSSLSACNARPVHTNVPVGDFSLLNDCHPQYISSQRTWWRTDPTNFWPAAAVPSVGEAVSKFIEDRRPGVFPC
jgi:hypothetical protein